MGSGISTENVFSQIRDSFRKNPNKTLQAVEDFNKEFARLRREAAVTSQYPNYHELSHQFDIMDYNKNGIISLAEIDKLIVESYPQFNNKPALMRAYKAADVNNSGLITLNEFKNLWKYNEVFNSLWKVFDNIDTDNDRRMSFEEFKNSSSSLFGSKLSNNEAKYLFSLIDTNNGGYILFKEFCTFMVRRKVALGPEN